MIHPRVPEATKPYPHIFRYLLISLILKTMIGITVLERKKKSTKAMLNKLLILPPIQKSYLLQWVRSQGRL